ncbi:hypothetical protein HHI36_009902 [Cryptolaemus montrouzieri]|uniref:PiggyBac transposable element-derived protein domain-containing protein n=1 Tax=Cryptolaemus montrouzieri TaxID=559131 RepID=A0ABD2MH62_9CUCU
MTTAPDYEWTLIQWYDEIKSDEGEEAPEDLVQNDDSSSEIDMDEGNEGEDGEDSVGVVLIDHPNDEDSNEVNDDEQGQSTSNKEKSFFGKDCFKWSSTSIFQSRKTPAKNLSTFIPGLRGPARFLRDTADPISIWENNVSDNMIQEIVARTNEKLQNQMYNYKNENKIEMQDTDIIEIRAFFGLLYSTEIFKSNNEDLDSLYATDGTVDNHLNRRLANAKLPRSIRQNIGTISKKLDPAAVENENVVKCVQET